MEPIDRIIGKIMEDAEWKIKEYERETQEKIEKIRKKEEERWEIEKKKLEYEGKREAEGIKSMLISRAYLEGKRELMDAKEEIIAKVIDLIKKNARNSPNYENYIRKCVKDALNVMGENIQIICLKDDKEIVERIVRETTRGATVVDGSVPFGGIVVVSKDYTRKVDYSIESLVERNINVVRREISKRLFEG